MRREFLGVDPRPQSQGTGINVLGLLIIIAVMCFIQCHSSMKSAHMLIFLNTELAVHAYRKSGSSRKRWHILRVLTLINVLSTDINITNERQVQCSLCGQVWPPIIGSTERCVQGVPKSSPPPGDLLLITNQRFKLIL